ncbi:MAG: hypothetical protein GF403_04780 [Candidatus Coatesbacteria bacterium]|nr:hypothetical protein [Candidatus Coatesbacteria bacterium]
MRKTILSLLVLTVVLTIAEPIDILIPVGNYNSFDELYNALDADPRTGNVTRISIRDSLPPLTFFQMYDCVVTDGFQTIIDPVAFGDLLADYVDGGGRVLCVFYAMMGSYGPNDCAPTGRWEAEGYCPYECINWVCFTGYTDLIIDEPGHPVMNGVSAVDNVWARVQTSLRSGAYELAHYVDAGGVAVDEDETVIGVNYRSRDDRDWTGDGWLLLANAACWLSDYSTVRETSWGAIKARGE